MGTLVVSPGTAEDSQKADGFAAALKGVSHVPEQIKTNADNQMVRAFRDTLLRIPG
jgi:hypothetical protein